MKPQILIPGVLIVAAVGGIAFQLKSNSQLREVNAALTQQVADAQAATASAVEAAKPDPAEAERIQQERTELLKLRGEVTSLRKEKEAWEKQAAASKQAAAAAAAAAARAAEVQKRDQEQKQNAAQAMNELMNAPAAVQGTQSGNVRRKFLAGEPLNESERGILQAMMTKSAEIEKNPQEFAAFQSSFISSLLGWSSDPRQEQIQGMITRVATVANERGFNYHAPAENANNWSEAQNNLNARGTSAVQNLLTPEERAVFDKAFIGVMGVDFGLRANP